ncbi:MAG: reverse transcriptase family protein [Planctomycetota bacterium]
MGIQVRDQRYSEAERLAYLFCCCDWRSDELIQGIRNPSPAFAKSLTSLITFLCEAFPDRPKLDDLVAAIESNESFQIASRKVTVRKRLRSVVIPHRSLVWLDWHLPEFRTHKILASHLGVAPRQLDWLTFAGDSPERRPEHYVARWFRKRRRGFRLIESPKSCMKNVQRIILQDVLSKPPVHPSAHGFCHRRSVLGFVKPHVNNEVCLRMDLKDFFPSVRGLRVQGLFRSLGYSSEIAKLLQRLTTCQTSHAVLAQRPGATGRGATESSQLYLPAHLPQGAPTSPMLANLMAFGLDSRLTGLANSIGAVYTRYADDLLLSGDRSFGRMAKRLCTTIGAIAIEEGFQVNFRKTRIQYSSQRQHAAGIVINQTTNIDRKVYDELKAILFNCIRFGPASENRMQHPRFRDHLIGRIEWVRQLSAHRAAKLKTLFDRIQW